MELHATPWQQICKSEEMDSFSVKYKWPKLTQEEHMKNSEWTNYHKRHWKSQRDLSLEMLPTGFIAEI